MATPEPPAAWRQPPTSPTGRRELSSVERSRRRIITVAALSLASGVVIGGSAVLPLLNASTRPMPTATAADPAFGVTARPSALGLDPAQTQRRGEWSPICGRTGEPLIDFSPVDRGQGRHKVVLTVHNCSTEPVTIDRPELWLGGRKGMTPELRLDTDRTHVTPLTLAPRTSAQAVLTWEVTGLASTPDAGVLSVHQPGIGDGELQEPLSLNDTSRVWLTGWVPA